MHEYEVKQFIRITNDLEQTIQHFTLLLEVKVLYSIPFFPISILYKFKQV